MNILETKQLSFKYNNQHILDNVDLMIPQGCIYGYLGRNGAGKTTTIKILLGLLNAPYHTVFFQNKEFRENRLEILSNIGSMIESPTYYNELTGWENLKYLDILYGCGNKRIKYVLELVGLNNVQNKKVKYYSTGMKQRLGIALSIYHDPNLLILDEPLNGLDPEGVHDMRVLLMKLKNDGKTILFSSHILGEVEKVCSHIGILDRGKLLYQGTIDKLLTNITKEILIKTDHPESCLSLCIQHNIPAYITQNDQLCVRINNENEFDGIMRLLVQNQVKICMVSIKECDLETVFMNLILK